ncbi:unnamed protein product [Trichogramma brassicae]|uniref:Uncharacterized protein n=1 Tax=Trichogramma brassicae TaxID=86971 RepID=A0A6H5I6V9_9HYME|nr:unnamed protein product [Trichogramma brassicae]
MNRKHYTESHDSYGKKQKNHSKYLLEKKKHLCPFSSRGGDMNLYSTRCISSQNQKTLPSSFKIDKQLMTRNKFERTVKLSVQNSVELVSVSESEQVKPYEKRKLVKSIITLDKPYDLNLFRRRSPRKLSCCKNLGEKTTLVKKNLTNLLMPEHKLTDDCNKSKTSQRMNDNSNIAIESFWDKTNTEKKELQDSKIHPYEIKKADAHLHRNKVFVNFKINFQSFNTYKNVCYRRKS